SLMAAAQPPHSVSPPPSSPLKDCRHTRRPASRPPRPNRLSYQWATQDRLKAIANSLGLSFRAVNALEQEVGFKRQHGKPLAAFRETDEHGRTVGIYLRPLDGSRGRCLPGSKRGLFNVRGAVGASRVFVTEGHTDAIGLLHIVRKQLRSNYRRVVGLPSSGAARDAFLRLRELHNIRHVAIFPDNDGPGWTGASKLRKDLDGRGIVVPVPSPYNDVRDWARAGASMQEVGQALIDAFENAPTEYARASGAQVMNRPKAEYLLEGLIHERSFAVLFGREGGGKTFLAIDWALCIQNGMDWPVTTAKVIQGPVVYVTGEGYGDFSTRLRVWEGERKGSAKNLEIIEEMPQLTDEEQVKRLFHDLRRFPVPPRLIVIDTYARTMRGQDENTVKAASMFNQAVEQIRNEFGSAVLVLHHTPWDQKRPRGSSALAADADVLIGLDWITSVSIKVHCAKMKYDRRFEDFWIGLVPMPVWNSEGEQESSCIVVQGRAKDEADPQTDQILAALGEGDMSSEEIGERIGKSQRTVQRLLDPLLGTKKVESVKKGREKRYRLVPEDAGGEEADE
ncbi:MAG: AAA family ATPase, partial [Phycisphaerales bacterium]